MIEFKCGECDAVIEVVDGFAGTDGKCPHCGAAVMVPGVAVEGASSPEAPAPASTPPAEETPDAQPQDAAAPTDASAPEADAAPEASGEQTLMMRRPVQRAYVRRILIGAGLVVAVTILLILFKVHLALALLLPLLIIGGGTWLRTWISVHANEYRLTTERLFYRKGLIARHIEEIELFRIKDVTVTQSAAERILGVGSVTILSTDDTTPVFVMRHIPNPVGAKEDLRAAFRAARKKQGVRATEFMPS